MKKYVLLLVVLVLAGALSGNGFCQTPGCPPNNLYIQKPSLLIQDVKNYPHLTGIKNGTYFIVDISTSSIPSALMNGLERISAKNTDSLIEDHVYEFSLTPTLRNFTADFPAPEKFNGQYGIYEVRIWRSTSVQPPLQPPCSTFPCPPPIPYTPPFTCYTDPIANNLSPLPIPENLKVSFESGPTTPTLSFDPVGGFLADSTEWYEIRIYDKDYSRRIYKVTIGMGSSCGLQTCTITDGTPSVTFPELRAGSQTNEDLVPGEEYFFRADLFKQLPGGNMLESTNFKSFKVPKKRMADH